MELHEQRETEERVILVGVEEQAGKNEEQSVKELGKLAGTANAEVAGREINTREKIHPSTYGEKGKIQELKEKIWELDATGIICNDELSQAQLNHLQEELEC